MTAPNPIAQRLRKRRAQSLAPIIAFHGCSVSAAESLLSVGTWQHNGQPWWKPSNKNYDWLGEGMYFWVDSPQRAYEWAQWKHSREPNNTRINHRPTLVGQSFSPVYA